MFITNAKAEGKKLGERLGELMECSSRLDMLVGFFYFSGIKVIAEPLRDDPRIRLRVLVGMEADTLCCRLVEAASEGGPGDADSVRSRYYDSLRRIVGSEAVDNRAFHERLGIFLGMLKEGRLAIRKTLAPNHAKLYVFTMTEGFQGLRPKVWITGSSNFSEPGLSLRDELNVEVSDFGAEESSGYFERLWEDAVPLTADDGQRRILAEILQDGSVAAEVTPFEAYFLIMRNYLEYQQSNLDEARLDRILADAGFRKYRYQTDAVAQAMARLDQYRGVIIADVVGLGKSIVAGLLGAMRRKRGIVICPPGLMGSPKGDAGGWHEYKHRFKLTDWVVWSRGDLEGLRERLRHDPDFEMVVVDEAHNFRNEGTRDYGCLADVCFGKDVVLLTATPFNNRPSDLLALLHLFSPGRNSPFVPGGDLDGRFRQLSRQYENAAALNKAISRKDWRAIDGCLKKCGIGIQAADGAADLRQVRRAAVAYGTGVARGVRQIMERIVIRRNRIDLASDPDYAPEIGTLSTVRPPDQQFFELTPEQDAFYDRVINAYFGPDGAFRGAVYRPQEYRRDKAGTDDYQNNLYTMMQRLLVMRFESSFGAFRQSLVNALEMMRQAGRFIDRMGCYLYSRQAMEHVLDFPDDADAFEEMISIAGKLNEEYLRSGKRGRRGRDIIYTMSDADFDDVRFRHDIASDVELLEKVIREVDTLELSTHDPKCARLTEVMREVLAGRHPGIPAEPGAPKRKILLFTAYSDTLRYLEGIVGAAFPGRVLAIDAGNFTAGAARKLKRNFDASFSSQDDDYDILLATDKLSEGFNLNRAGLVINYDIPWNPTRVIQRVGRINRIGRKVFADLYIFNFFPTVKGAAVNQNREIAQNKMFAIHRILGEDARIFSIEEEPTAAALYSKLKDNAGEDAAPSFYSELKRKYAQAKRFLEENHPDELKRIARFPGMVKTAWRGAPAATFMFRRQGPGFFALACSGDGGRIEERTLEDAIQAIECPYETPREEFSPGFWSAGGMEDGRPAPGIYDRLKRYTPAPAEQRGGVSDAAQAVANLQKAMPMLPEDLRSFARVVVEDLQSYRIIPLYTIRLLARPRSWNEPAAADISHTLAEIRDHYGHDYLRNVKKAALRNEIVVTIEKR